MSTYDPARPSEVYEDHYGRRYAEPPPIRSLPKQPYVAADEPAAAAAKPRSGGRRLAMVFAALVTLVLGAGTAGAATYLRGGGPAMASFTYPSASPSGSAAAAPGGGAADVITLSATGDVVLGTMPPATGKGIFDAVRDDIAADLAMANLEQPLTDDTGVSKCSAQNAGKSCFAFRSPPGAVQHLAHAGFHLVTLANNHSYDFGSAGYRTTQETLDGAGIRYTGGPDQITVLDVKGVKTAVVGFASYYWTNLCSDLGVAAAVVQEAAKQAAVVVVQVHMGAEGADRTHTRNQTESYLGENRCNPVAFAHAVVDAGADLVIGHGPHVMRGMEFYQGRLIAYSLGNFASYRTQDFGGVVGLGGVLRVSLRPDGRYVRGSLVPTHMVAPGVPRPDAKRQAIAHVGGLSKADFPKTGARIAADGTITGP